MKQYLCCATSSFAVLTVLFAAQDIATTEGQDADSSASKLVWALNALIDSNKVNQLSLQAAGGLHISVSLLAQACLQLTPCVSPRHSVSDECSDPQPMFQSSQCVQPSLVSSQTDTRPCGELLEQQELASALVWLISSAAAGVPANQNALHQAGAVHLLLHQLRWSRLSAATNGALWALGSMAEDNPDVQADVQLQA